MQLLSWWSRLLTNISSARQALRERGDPSLFVSFFLPCGCDSDMTSQGGDEGFQAGQVRQF